MHIPNEFEKAYFIQTRSEIDTEKKERDHMLNFAILVLGAVGFSISQDETSRIFLQSPEGFLIDISVLVIISSMFWIRYKKLRQIADRWFVLRRLTLRWFGNFKTNELLEGLVCDNLPTLRYIIKDVVLNLALSSPIYGLLYRQLYSAFLVRNWWLVISVIGVFVMHLAFTFFVLGKKIKDPLPPIELDNQNEQQL